MKSVTKKRFSVKWRILIPIVILNAIIMGLLGFFAIQQSSAVTRELAAEIAGVSAEYAASRVDPELLPAIVEGAEDSEEFKTILNSLYEVMSNNPIFYAYTLTTDGTNVYNGVVAGFDEKIGTKSNVVYSHVEAAFHGTTVQDNTIHKTAYGQLINSYVPIKDANGNVVSILGCAYNAADVMKRAETLNLVVLATLVLGVLVMSAACYVLVQRVTKPLESATRIIREVRNCNLYEYPEFNIPNNEIGDIIHDSVSMSDGLRLIINDIRDMLDQMGQGNFLVKSSCEERYTGAYSEILSAMYGISDRLRKTLAEIRLSSQQVNMGAEQVAAGAQTISQGATEQLASVEELTANVEEIVKQVNTTAANAQNATQLSQHTTALIDGTVLAVDRGANIADETAKSLLVAVQQSKDVEAKINDISNACDQQTASAEQISRGLSEIRLVVESSSVTSQSSAAASEELSGQANLMEQMVSQFKI